MNGTTEEVLGIMAGDIHPVSPLDAIGNTPLIELDALRPEGGARIFAKWEGANPTGSMKDRMARAMIEGARRDGALVPGQHVVEYTGGSSGLNLAAAVDVAAKRRPDDAVVTVLVDTGLKYLLGSLFV